VKTEKHRCSEHIVVRSGPNGGAPRFRCGQCSKPIRLRLRADQVLVRRVPA
jgi:hypothetical protein